MKKNYIFFIWILFLLCKKEIISAQIINRIAGIVSSTGSYSGDGGAALLAHLDYCTGVAIDGLGNIYIADEGNDAIRKISPTGVVTTLIGGLSSPTGIAVDKYNNLYITEASLDLVLKWSSGVLTSIAGYGSGYSGDGGLATAAALYNPEGIAVDTAGNVYIADDGNNAIRKIDATTGIIHTIAGTGTSGYSGDYGPAISAKLSYPVGVAVDKAGNVYITDNGCAVREIVASTGYIYTIAGHATGEVPELGDGGPAISAYLAVPYGIAVDTSDNIYIVDELDNRIRKINAAGIISTIAGDGTDGYEGYYYGTSSYGNYSGDGGPADSSELSIPTGVAVDALGNVYIADAGNYIIREIGPSHGIFFNAGALQSFLACENAPISVDSLLLLTDTVAGEPIIWSVAGAPAHGTVAASYSATSTGGAIVPVGLVYTPTAYYTGPDSFTVKATNGSMIVYTMIRINVQPAPYLNITAGYSTICNGTTTYLFVEGSGAIAGGDTVLNQNFNGGIAPWTVDTSGSVGTSLPFVDWNDVPNNYADGFGTFHNPDSTSFALVDAYDSGPFSVTKSKLISPSFSTIGYSDAALYFDQSYKKYSDTSAEVDISTDGGAIWTTLVNYTLTAITDLVAGIHPFLPESVSLSAYVGYPDVRIRFYYNSPAQGWYWAIDNIAVVGYPTGINAATWSPAGSLFTDANHTDVYAAGGYRDTVYFHPTAITSTTDVTYYATEAIGSCAVTDSITITVLPAASIMGNNSVCLGSYDTLTDVAPYGSWVASNNNMYVGFSSGIAQGVATGADTITYTSTLGGCAGTYTTVVTVVSTPLPGIITGSDSVCAGASILLADAGTGGVWNSANANAVISTDGTATGITAGTDTISYSIINACGSVTDKKGITIDPLADAGTITGLSSVCAGDTLLLTDTATGGSWSSVSTGIASISAPGVVVGIASGNDTIKYAVTNTCGTITASLPIGVDALPVAGPVAGADSLCTGASITLTFGSPGGMWSRSNTDATILAGTVTGVNAGTDTISYIVTNSCGADTAGKTVVILSLPVAGIITGPDSLCVDASIALTADSLAGIWSSSNAVATILAGTVTGVSAGADTITYIVTNSCGADTASKAVVILPLPVAGIITGTDTLCAGDTASLSVSTSGGIWSSASSSVATITTAGLATGITAGTTLITYSVTNSCGSAEATHPLVILPLSVCNSGVKSITANDGLLLQPNPNKGSFTFQLVSGISNPVTVIITNVAGEKIKEFVTTTNTPVTIDMNVPPGMYFLSATAAGGIYTAKVMVN